MQAVKGTGKNRSRQSYQKVVPNTAFNLEFSGQLSSVNVEKQKLSPNEEQRLPTFFPRLGWISMLKWERVILDILLKTFIPHHEMMWANMPIGHLFQNENHVESKDFQDFIWGNVIHKKKLQKSCFSSLTMGRSWDHLVWGFQPLFLAIPKSDLLIHKKGSSQVCH